LSFWHDPEKNNTVIIKKRPNFDMGFKCFIALNKIGIKIAILFLLVLPALTLQGQARTQKKIERREVQLDRKERKDYEKRRKEALKHRYSIQSPEVQARMKESKKKADSYNRKKKEPFFERLFKKKRKKKPKKKPR
jgi:hypothetical protein